MIWYIHIEFYGSHIGVYYLVSPYLLVLALFMNKNNHGFLTQFPLFLPLSSRLWRPGYLCLSSDLLVTLSLFLFSLPEENEFGGELV